MAKEPINQSRAAGAAAPKSAAATAPMEGATGGLKSESGYPPFKEDAGPTFYSPDDGAQQSDKDDIGGDPQVVASYEQRVFTGSVRSGSVQIEQGGSVDREIGERMAEEVITDPEELAAEIARIREFRKPIGAYSQKLALPVRSGYHRHWFNDTAGRIEEAVNNGWAHVKGNDGKPISRCVGTGRDKGAMYAFAMEIPEVFWLEDMAAKNRAATEKMEGLKASPFQSKPGQAKAADSGKFYDPVESPSGPVQIVKH